ncbi:winged helix-turn-helix domain-containing protein [Pseudomonas sp. 30_B]|uniref:winged helix-turn-helix domain-containing protein n=1 Tax=Pseudomonas sp. 30_B TaxID=2813575 RepID=UPI001A9CB9A7|nr:winged helix-turn-helix domain-containing protein [Pseudomonas sp. 30_B]
MSRFLINHCVMFDTDNFTLQRWPDDAQEPQRLGVFASRCLLQLLLSQAVVVGKRDLMEGAWGKFGLEVTENSLAQVVRQLRVAFEAILPGQECIITVPRIGYRLSERLSWQAYESCDAAPTALVEEELAAPLASLPPAEQEGRRHTHWPIGRWILATLVLGILAYLAGALLPTPGLKMAPLSFAAPLKQEDVLIYLPTGNSEPTVQELRRWREQALHVARLAQWHATPLHLYLLAPQKTQGFLCTAPLLDERGKCLGMLPYEITY